MGIELVTHQSHPLALSIVFIQQLLDLVSPIDRCSTLRHNDLALTVSRFCNHEDVCRAVVFVFIIHRL